MLKNNLKIEMYKNKLSPGIILLKLRTFIMLGALLIFFSFRAPNFLSIGNFLIMSKHVAIYSFLAIGMTFVIITGGIDLSVGSIVGLAAMIAGGLIHEGLVLNLFGITIYYNVIIIIFITLVMGILVGGINGIVITKCKVAPFIATLGMYYVARGFANIRSGGETFSNLVGKSEYGNTGFPILGSASFFGINLSIWLMIIIAAIAIYIAKKTPLGRHIFAVGGNENAAKLSGINVDNTRMFVYMFSGFCSALAGLIIASQLVAAHPATGETYELNAIAAAVLGGTSMSGGRGSIFGTIVGAFVIGVLNDGMSMMGITEFWQKVIKGTVIVIAVIVDQLQANIQKKIALQQQNK